MMDSEADLGALFRQPAPLPDADRLLREILSEVDRQQRYRRLWLWAAAILGVCIPAAFFSAAGASPAARPLLASFRSFLAVDFGRLADRLATDAVPLARAGAPFGFWVVVALGLVAVGIAAARTVRLR